MPASRAFGVDCVNGGKRHHTVVMAPGVQSAKAHVRVSRPGCTVLNAYRVPATTEGNPPA